MSPRRRGLTGVIIVLWRALRNNGRVPMRTSHSLLRNQRHRATIVSARMSKWKLQWYKPRRLHSLSVGCVMSPRDAVDLEWPLSVGMQVSGLQPFWIAMIISCWNVKLLKLPSVSLTHVCGTNSHNWWAKGLPGVGVVKIFCDSSGWKSFRHHSPRHSTANWQNPSVCSTGD